MIVDDYRAFSVLADTLHFARAAVQLGMSPSALTRTVQRLEDELGQTLLVRDRRNVSLSRAGAIFLEHARRQLDAHGALLERLAEDERDPVGELRIACTVTACHSILPDLLSRCRARYPRIQLQLMTSDAVQARTRLERGEVHVAVVPEPEPLRPDLSFAPLARTPLRFIAPGGAGSGAPDFASDPLILPEAGLERERFDRFLAARGIQQPNVYTEVNGNEAIIAMVSLGCGIGLVPELVLAGSPLRDAITVLQVPDGPPGYTVGLCAKQRSLSQRALAVFWSLAS